ATSTCCGRCRTCSRTRRIDARARVAGSSADADRMFKHILVPIDLSDRNTRALRTARTLAMGSGARVTLLHVVQRVPNISVQEMRPFYRRLLAASRKKLSATAVLFAAHGLAVRSGRPDRGPACQSVRLAAP